MIINVISDAHFEFGTDYKLLAESLAPSDVLVLAGDMCTYNTIHLMEDFLSLIPSHCGYVLYVLGNHEFYGCYDMNEAIDSYRNLPCLLLDNEQVIIDGVNFVGTTLWTDFDKGALLPFAEQFMPDYKCINLQRGRPITPQDILKLHHKGLLCLKDQFVEGLKNVAITHHSTSFQSNQGRFSNSPTSGFFHSEVDLFGCDLCLFGHTHESVDYIHPLGYRVVSNQLGYPSEDGTNFIINKLVEV